MPWHAASGYGDRVRTPSWVRSLSEATTRADVVLAGSLALVAGVESVATGGDNVELRVVQGCLTVAMLALRRRHPLASTSLIAVGLALESVTTESPDEIAVLLAVVISAYSVAAWAGRRDALVGLAFLAVSIALSISQDPSDEVANIAPTLLLFIFLPAGLGFAFRGSRQRVTDLELRTQELETEAAAALDHERRRIARELHDVVSHAVTLIAVQSEAGRSTLDRDPAATGRALDAIGVASRDALAELHSMLALLRDAEAAGTPYGLARLPALVDGARSAGAAVEVAENGGPDLREDVDHCAFRVVQEGLTNALRHTHDPHVRVGIEHRVGGLEVTVLSNGRPHQSSYGGTRLGLLQLEERVRALGGSLRTGPVGTDGFSLAASFPQATT